MATRIVDAPSLSSEPEHWRQKARALIPEIQAARDQARHDRQLPAALIAGIKSAGLFAAFRPKRWGGAELDPRVLFEVQNVFAEQCLSTAWVYGVLSVQSFLLGRMDPRAQADVWGDDPETLVSSSFAPVAKVAREGGGYRIGGRFTFSSGSGHADWAMVGGMVPPEAAGGPPQMRLFLVPRADYRIDDVWDTIGLRGTGSNDIVIEDAFVPEYRTYAPDPGVQTLGADSGLPDLYRLPWLHMFTSTISNLGVGAGRAALADFVATARTRKAAFTNTPSSEDARFLAMIGRARAEIDMVEGMAHRNFTLLIDHVAQDRPLAMDEALQIRAQLMGSLRRIAALVDEMMLLLGGRGIRTDGPLTRVWLDMAAARAHPGNDPAMVQAQLAGATFTVGA